MATLKSEIAVREHDLGWHHGKTLTGRCRDCAREYRRLHRPSRARLRWVQPDLWAA